MSGLRRLKFPETLQAALNELANAAPAWVR